jgi:hypothetical protein
VLGLEVMRGGLMSVGKKWNVNFDSLINEYLCLTIMNSSIRNATDMSLKTHIASERT